MAQSPLAYPKFRLYFATAWLLLAVLYSVVLRSASGFAWQAAFTEGFAVFLTLLPAVAACLLMPHFYLPPGPWYIYTPLISAFYAYLVVWLAQKIIPLLLADPAHVSENMGLRWFMAFILLSGISTAGILWAQGGEKADADRRRAELHEKVRDAELHKLQHQLQPHFLFNSLNSINALVQTDPQQAQVMVQKLSDFLRFTLKRADEQWVNVEHETEYLNLYLDIEKIRFRHRLELRVNIDAAAEKHKIPTLILQPIVENAIKFGLYGTTGQVSITVDAVVEKAMIKITVTNPFDTDMQPSGSGTGFGLKAVQRRLQLLYNRNDLLQTGHSQNIYTTVLLIPVQHS